MKYAIVEISGRQFWIETGKYYYRLKQTDFDGTFKYSPEIFYKIYSLTYIYKFDYLQYVFMLLEKNIRDLFGST